MSTRRRQENAADAELPLKIQSSVSENAFSFSFSASSARSSSPRWKLFCLLSGYDKTAVLNVFLLSPPRRGSSAVKFEPFALRNTSVVMTPLLAPGCRLAANR